VASGLWLAGIAYRTLTTGHWPLTTGLCVSAVNTILFLSCLLQAQTKPNVLLITIDTLRADRLGSYGYSRARTPVLDALAREGVRFEKAFSPAPLTLPAHASILTGVYPSTHGIRDNSGFLLSPDQTTLAEVLKKSGYATSAFVGAFVLDSKFGLDQGFDTYFDNFDLSRYENISPGYIQHSGDKVVGETIRWLEANSIELPALSTICVRILSPSAIVYSIVTDGCELTVSSGAL